MSDADQRQPLLQTQETYLLPVSLSKDKQLTSGARSIEHLQKLLEGSVLLLIGALSTGEPAGATGEDWERPPVLTLGPSGAALLESLPCSWP